MPIVRNAIIFSLICAGTVGATLGVARSDPREEGWERKFQVQPVLTGTSLAVLALGIVLRYATLRPDSDDVAASSGSLAVFRGAMAALDEAVEQLARDTEGIDWADERVHGLYDEVHQRIDLLVTGPLADAVESRQALADAYGMAAYGRVLEPVARAERYLNRAWSASADGYPGETVDYLHRAVPAVEEACQELAALAQQEPPSTEEPHHGQT